MIRHRSGNPKNPAAVHITPGVLMEHAHYAGRCTWFGAWSSSRIEGWWPCFFASEEVPCSWRMSRTSIWSIMGTSTLDSQWIPWAPGEKQWMEMAKNMLTSTPWSRRGMLLGIVTFLFVRVFVSFFATLWAERLLRIPYPNWSKLCWKVEHQVFHWALPSRWRWWS